MYGIIFKYRFRLIAALGLVAITTSLFSQNKDEVRSLKLTMGGGYGYYFNTFTNVLDQDVNNIKPAFYGKLLWQTEYRLRIGLESGYYFIYSTTRIQTDNKSEKLTSNLKVVPIFLSLSMKMTKHLELNFATGWASMIYVININKSTKNKVIGHTYSMSNCAAGFTYFIPLGKKIDLGTEFKYLYLGKTDDQHISVFLNVSYKIKNWKVK
jgi:hypothetical protein